MLIRFGQWLRPSWRPWKRWNHTAIVAAVGDVTHNGNMERKIVCIQMSRKCEAVGLKYVSPNGYRKIFPCPPNVDRDKAVKYATSQLGVDYSVATIFSIALTLITPKAFRFNFRRSGDGLICSALVARAWEHGGWQCPTDPFQITPAELAQIVYPEAKPNACN